MMQVASEGSILGWEERYLMRSDTVHPTYGHSGLTYLNPKREQQYVSNCVEGIFPPNSCDVDGTDKKTVSRSVCLGGSGSKVEG